MIKALGDPSESPRPVNSGVNFSALPHPPKGHSLSESALHGLRELPLADYLETTGTDMCEANLDDR
jgi:hypothetical protein